MDGRYVSYIRVSTDGQGRSGLGLEGQRAAVQAFIAGKSGALLAEHREIESGAVNSRPELARALDLCRLTGASLVVAKIDRLSRDAHFLLGLQRADVPITFADMPHADEFTVGILGLVAQRERQLISERTKAALAAAKARGVQLGGFRGGPIPDATVATEVRVAKADAFAARVAPVARALKAEGRGLEAIAAELSRRGIKTARGGQWAAQTVKNLLARGQVERPRPHVIAEQPLPRHLPPFHRWP